VHVTDIPNLAAMLILIAILVVFQRKRQHVATGTWVVALSLILASQISWYFARDVGPWHIGVHTFRLCADLCAGVVFLLYDSSPISHRPRWIAFVAWNGASFIALEALYGFDIARPWPYLVCALSGVVAAIVTAIVLKNDLRIGIAEVSAWLAIAAFSLVGNYRAAAYWGLGTVYLGAGVNLWIRMGKGGIGKIVMIASLWIWAASFFIHPWVLHSVRYRPMSELIWSLQKFFVAIGMLIVFLEEEMHDNERLAFHDQLTGLPNRRRIEKLLLEGIERGAVSIILLDLDGFKEINDSVGHLAGDEILCQIAGRLTQIMGPKHTVARLGGDEFLVISSGPVESLASSILAILPEANLTVDGFTFKVNVSVGTSSYPQDAAGRVGMEAVRRLLSIADTRMYTLKDEHGRNRDSRSQVRRASDRRDLPLEGV
jgi:diguanylate cyclase (GGDEF)-like protein